MASYYLAPDPLQGTWFVPGGNTPASGGQLFSYVAGSSTKTTLYKDNAGGSSWTNPIVLDSGGNLPSGGQIWIPTGVTIDVVFAPANDVDPPQSPYRTLQDVSGINDVNASASEWVTGPTPLFVSGTQFVVQGDQTATLKNGRRIRSTNSGGTIYGRITSVTASAGSTTVNTVSDSGTLDSGLSAVAYGLLDPQNTSIDEYHVFKDGGSVASVGNGTTNIWGIAGNSVHITGTNTIHSFSSASYAGAKRTIIFDGSLTLQTSSAFLSAPIGNIVTQAGDRAEILASTTAHSVITQYMGMTGSLGKPLGTSTFTAAGTYNKPANLRSALVVIKGGGGSGGGSAASAPKGGGGGEGETAWALFNSSTLSASTAVVIGFGGGAIATSTSANGLIGSTTSFGGFTAVGGSGGTQGPNGGAGGAGGTGGSNGFFRIPGAAGQAGTDDAAANGFNAAGGGNGGGASGMSGASGGGGGNGSTENASGAGGNGFCVVIEFY